MKQPASVVAATAEYQHDSDKITQFVEEMLEADAACEIKTSDVYREYSAWCGINHYGTENIKNFNQALRSFAEVTRKRPKGGGGATTVLRGYRIVGRASAL